MAGQADEAKALLRKVGRRSKDLRKDAYPMRRAEKKTWRVERTLARRTRSLTKQPKAMGRRKVQVDKRRSAADLRTRLNTGGKEGTKQTKGMGSDAFHPWVLSDFSWETCQQVADFPACCGGHWQVSSNNKLYHVFFLLPQTVGGHRPIAQWATQLRCGKRVRADIMANLEKT